MINLDDTYSHCFSDLRSAASNARVDRPPPSTLKNSAVNDLFSGEQKNAVEIIVPSNTAHNHMGISPIAPTNDHVNTPMTIKTIHHCFDRCLRVSP